MKILILNGSPHINGNTTYITNKLKEKLTNNEIEEIFLYKEKISPCIDCRYCSKNVGCAINDKAQILYKDDYDVLILASPIYMYNVTPPCFSLITRLNAIWSNEYFLNIKPNFREKKGVLVLTGGGDGKPTHAMDMAKLLFRKLNASFDIDKDYIYSLKTNTISVEKDKNIDLLINNAINRLKN